LWWVLSGFTHGGLSGLLHAVERNPDSDPTKGSGLIYVRADSFVWLLVACGRAAIATTARRIETLWRSGRFYSREREGAGSPVRALPIGRRRSALTERVGQHLGGHPARNTEVASSPVSPATNGFSESSRKPTISWAFVLFQRISTGLSTGLSGLFIGTYSALAYAAYAGWRYASGPHAAPLRLRVGPVWRCIGQPYARPMQVPCSTFWRRSRVGRKNKPCCLSQFTPPVPKLSTGGPYGHSRLLPCSFVRAHPPGARLSFRLRNHWLGLS
jgi:hypothetical protein